MRWLNILAALILAAPAAAQQAPLSARFDSFTYSGSNPGDAPLEPWTYRNPILGGFYPDPSVTRVGDAYYLVTSTFSYFPGIPVFKSPDLVHWTQIGNAIDRPDQLDFKQLGLSRGVFAPTITARDGVFYILNTCVDCGGNFVITAKDPAGPWSDPVWLPELEGGIDPSLFFDEDGRSWILNNGPPEGKPQYEGHRAIWIQGFDLKGLKTIGPRKLLVNGGVDFSTKPIWIEGPHILKREGWYYLICAEGGTAEGHSQVALRSKSVTGPYEPNPANPILTQRGLPADRPLPVTSAGHAQLVQAPNGEWWATFLAVRPYEGDFYNTGRETFLMPVYWHNGWPRITEPGQPIPAFARKSDIVGNSAPVPTSGTFGVTDEFEGDALPPYWMMMRNPRERWHRLDQGALVLTARSDGLGDNANPSFLARRQQHSRASAETLVHFTPGAEGDRAGLAVLQNDDYWYAYGVERHGGKTVLAIRTRTGPDSPRDGELIHVSESAGRDAGAAVPLRIDVNDARVTFYRGVSLGTQGLRSWEPVLALDARPLSTKTAGGFVGAVFGMFAQKGE